jgi:hypothetical protein
MTIMEEQRQQQPVQTPQANGEAFRSGYARFAIGIAPSWLKRSCNYFALLDPQAALQRDVDNLLAQHDRLMKAAKATPQAAAWFESANLTLAQLAQDPDPRAVQIFVAALAQLQSRVSPIVMRTPMI